MSMHNLLSGQKIISKFLHQDEELRTWSNYFEYDHSANLKSIKPPFPGANFAPTLKQELKIKNIKLSRGLFFVTNKRIIFSPMRVKNENIEENKLISVYHSTRKSKVVNLEKVMWKRIGFLGRGDECFLIRVSENLPSNNNNYFAFSLSNEYARVTMKNIFNIFI
jgi:hypothetical protein